MVRILASLAAAALYALALPPFGWTVLGWLTLVPLLLAVRDRSSRAAFGHGLLFGTAGCMAVAWWLPLPLMLAWLASCLPVRMKHLPLWRRITVAANGPAFAGHPPDLWEFFNTNSSDPRTAAVGRRRAIGRFVPDGAAPVQHHPDLRIAEMAIAEVLVDRGLRPRDDDQIAGHAASVWFVRRGRRSGEV